MKSLYNKLDVIAAIGFVLGTLFSIANLYNLPVALEKASGKIDLTLIREVSPVLSQTYFVLGATLFMGLAGIFLGFGKRKSVKASKQETELEKESKSGEKRQETTEEENSLAKHVKEIQTGVADLKEQKVKLEKILSGLCKKIEASQGIIYSVKHEKDKRFIELFTSFAYTLPDSETLRYEFGEGLSGQVAKEGKKINITDIPKGYITIVSGLGSASPSHLAIFPIMKNGEVIYVVEIASFKEISPSDEALIVEALKLEDEHAGSSKQEGADKKESASKSKNK